MKPQQAFVINLTLPPKREPRYTIFIVTFGHTSAKGAGRRDPKSRILLYFVFCILKGLLSSD